MSEPLAGDEKRVEPMADTAKNERDIEQGNEDFITDWWTYLKGSMWNVYSVYMKPTGKDDRFEQEMERLREKISRIEKEKAEVEELLKRSEEARIEMEREMKEEKERKRLEEKERQIREEEARLERAKIHIELEMLREKTARFEKEREEAEERKRERKYARIERERIVAQKKEREDEERRLMNERRIFPFLALPKELQYKVYPHFDLEARRALRIVEELEEIEMNTKYKYERLEVTIEEDNVVLTVHKGRLTMMICDVPHSEVEKELEIMAKSTKIDEVYFESNIPDHHQITNSMQSLNAREIRVFETPSFNDSDLQSFVHNREEVSVYDQNSITESGLFWIYEKMRDRQLDLKEAYLMISEGVRWNFLDKFGTLDRENMSFIGTNPNQMVNDIGDFLTIREGELKIVIDKNDEDDEIGTVRFEYGSD